MSPVLCLPELAPVLLSVEMNTCIACVCRNEHLLLFLVQTMGRQLVEQRQYKSSQLRSVPPARKMPIVDAGLSGLDIGLKQRGQRS